MKNSYVMSVGPLECWIGAHKEHRLYSSPSCCSRQALQVKFMVIIVLGKWVCCWWCLKIRQKWCTIPSRAPIRLPENVVVDVVIVTKREGVRPECLCLQWSHLCLSSGAHSSRDRWGVDFVLRRRGDALWEGRLRHPLRPRSWQASGTWAPAYFIWTGFERWGTRLPIIQYHRSTFNLIERKKPLGL